MRVKDILDFLSKKYPPHTACDFDNTGLIVGNEKAPVSSVLISLDCDINTVKYALDCGCSLIITHHPIIFEPLKTVKKGDTVFELIENKISVISMHTNLDMGAGGVNDSLCNALGLKCISPYTAKDGFIMRSAVCEPQTADDLAMHIKSCLGGTVRYTDSNRMLNKLLICSGSGGSYITEAIENDFDALITAEVKQHQFIDAVNNNVSVFDAGHYLTENTVLIPLSKMLSEHFTEMSFTVYNNPHILSV